MIKREKIEELLKLPVDERRQVLRLLQESLPENRGSSPTVRERSVTRSHREPDFLISSDQTSPAAKWLLSMAGRYSGGPGNTATRADEILRSESDKRRGLTTN
ncbi:MAG TPA: hypothetical protein VGJ48_21865 [Pyrinomonadaceae bacterium]